MSDLNDDLDAFERRFGAAIQHEAQKMTVPVDGLDQIRGRLDQRRRARRVRWFAASAALVLVVGVAGLALRSARHDSAPYVGSNEMPLLGFNDQPLSVSPYVPGVAYSVPDFARQNNGIVSVLSVWSESGGFAPSLPEGTEPEDIEVAGQPATLISLDVQGRPYAAIEWAPAPGYRAIITVDGTLSADPRTDAKAAAERVTTQNEAAFEAALTGSSPQGDYPLPPLIPDAGTKGVQLLEVRSGSRLTLQYDGDTDGSFVGLQVFAGYDLTDFGDQVLERPTVRGTEGQVLESSTDGGPSFRLLRWNETGRAYQLRYPTSMTTAQAVAEADSLRSPTSDEWRSLLFPPQPVQWPGEDWFQWLLAPPTRPS